MADGAYTQRVGEHFLRDPSIPVNGVITRCLIYDFVTGRPELLRNHREGIGLLPVGIEGGDVWNKFTTSRNCTTRDFEGRASVTAIGASVGVGVGSTDFHMFPERGARTS